MKECQKAKFFAKNPSKIPRHPATNVHLPGFRLTNPNPELALFQPYLSETLPTLTGDAKSMPHENASALLQAHFARDAKSSTSDTELFNKVWADFIAPWFGLTVDGDGKDGESTDTYSPGIRVQTPMGDGQIISVAEPAVNGKAAKYLVKFSFGVGYVFHGTITRLMASGSDVMDTSADGDATNLMAGDIQVLFGTEKMYLFMRLYIRLVKVLYEAMAIVHRKAASGGEAAKADLWSKVILSLKELLRGKISAKAFEAACRTDIVNDVYNFVAIPPLVEKCAEALVKMAREDQYENLYQCSQLKLKVRDFRCSILCCRHISCRLTSPPSLQLRTLINFGTFLLI